MNASLKVFLNTISLYIKLVFTIVIGLYLTRIVLDHLGVEDFGIYNLIGGVIAILSFLQTALSISTQRYLSISMGKKNDKEITTVYSSSLAIHLVLSFGVLLAFELCSLFLFNDFLNIPKDRVWAAKIVFQIMTISTILTILQVTYTAEITAHEDLWLLAIIETFSALLKLCIIFIFDWSTMDDLILYSSWMLITTFFSFSLKLIWSINKYKECRIFHIGKCIEKNTIKKMLGFTGWNAFGTLALIGRNQGVAVLQNIFFGTTINAVYGIANQVNSHLVYCSSIMTTSLTPQIMKSEGEGDRKRMLRLSIFASKMAFFLSSFFALPLIIEIDTILSFWLKDVPEYTATYCILILCMFIIMQLYPGLTRAIQAIGKIKNYQIATSILLLLPIPIGYTMYKFGMHHTCVLFLMILSQALQMVYAIWYLNQHTGFSLKHFYLFIAKALTIFLFIYIFGKYFHLLLLSHTSPFITFLISCSCTLLLFTSIALTTIFDKQERESVFNLLKTLIKKH